MVDYREIIPVRLKYLRTKYQYKQDYLAQQLGISQGTYANWEAGKRLPGIDDIANLADIYETSVDLLLGRTDIRRES